jgi:acyl-CoA-binding protein
MADLKKQFEAAAADIKNLKKRPDDEDMLRL